MMEGVLEITTWPLGVNTQVEKQRFINILNYTFRPGIQSLLDWLENDTDFFNAPASTKYHDAFDGGLLHHSLRVYDFMLSLDNNLQTGLDRDSIVIVSLFHDVCKANCYIKDWRNVKTYLPDKTVQYLGEDIKGYKSDSRGYFTWESVPCYKMKEQQVYGGHGAKSVYLIHRLMQLSFDEAAAIHNHMGAYEDTQYGKSSSVYERNKLAFLLHLADELATFMPDDAIMQTE